MTKNEKELLKEILQKKEELRGTIIEYMGNRSEVFREEYREIHNLLIDVDTSLWEEYQQGWVHLNFPSGDMVKKIKSQKDLMIALAVLYALLKMKATRDLVWEPKYQEQEEVAVEIRNFLQLLEEFLV